MAASHRGIHFCRNAGSRRALHRIAAAFFLLALALSLVPIASRAAQADEPSAAQAISVVFTNDVHCAIDSAAGESLGYAGVAAIANDQAELHGSGNVTVIDAGDAVQGAAVGMLTSGEAIVGLMNAVGYDYAVAGNHEFDYGMGQFDALVAQSDATYLSCNFIDLRDGETVLAPYAITTYAGVSDGKAADGEGCAGGSATTGYMVTDGEGGMDDGAAAGNVSADGFGDVSADGVLKVAYVGISTPETLTKTSPESFKDDTGAYVYGFCEDATGQALYESVQEAVDSARSEGADYVVAVGHLGNGGITPAWASKAVIANTTGIDAFIDGHSHETYVEEAPVGPVAQDETVSASNAGGERIPLAQTGTKLSHAGVLTIDPSADEAISVELVSAADYANVDAGVQAAVDEVNASLDDELSAVVGESLVDLLSEDAESGLYVRRQETNLGDFVADAYRVRLGADIGLVNGGGVRASLAAGEVTKGDLIDVQPFGNTLCLVAATGQDILDALEMGSRSLPDYDGGFLQVSGLAYKVRADIPSSVVVDEHGAFAGVDGQRRVYDVRVGGEPIDPDATYTVASHDYMLLEGGDGMSMFSDCEVLLEDAALDNQALIDYVAENLGGVIGEGYEDPQGAGRIQITGAPDQGEDGDAGEGDGDDGSGDQGEGAGGADGGIGNGSDDACGDGGNASAAGRQGGFAQTGDGTAPVAMAVALVAGIAATGIAAAFVRVRRR